MQIFSDLYKEERKEDVILFSNNGSGFLLLIIFRLPENFLIHFSVQQLLSQSDLNQPIALKFF